MRKSEGDPIRKYRLEEEALHGAVNALVVLAEGLGGAPLAMFRPDDPETEPVPIEPSLLGPLVDLVSLLVCKGEASVLVLDGNDEISVKEAQQLLRCRHAKVAEILGDEARTGRRHMQRSRIKLGDVLAAMSR
jgi:hypothetical protein